MPKPRHLTLLLLAGAIALAGCGSSSTPSGGTSAGSTSAGSTSAGSTTSIGGLSPSTKLSSPAVAGQLAHAFAAEGPQATASVIHKAILCYVQKLKAQGVTTLGQAHAARAESSADAKACLLSAMGH